jgi:hypothetical protein
MNFSPGASFVLIVLGSLFGGMVLWAAMTL